MEYQSYGKCWVSFWTFWVTKINSRSAGNFIQNRGRRVFFLKHLQGVTVPFQEQRGLDASSASAHDQVVLLLIMALTVVCMAFLLW